MLKMSEVQTACSRDIMEYAVRKAQDVSVEWPSHSLFSTYQSSSCSGQTPRETTLGPTIFGRSTYAVIRVRWLHKTRHCTSVA